MSKNSPIPENAEEIQQLVDDRDKARLDRDYETADAIRDQLYDLGVHIHEKRREWSMGLFLSCVDVEAVGVVIVPRFCP